MVIEDEKIGVDELYEEIESEFIRSKGEEMLDKYLSDLRNWYDVIKADEL